MLGTAFDDVLLAAQAGAGWACRKIYEDLAGVVTGYLRRQGAEEPDDVASETFLDVFRNIKRFEGDEEQFRSWVFTIAHRRWVDERRRIGRRPETSSLDDVLDFIDTFDVEAPQVQTAVEDEAELAALNRHLSRLSDDQRDIVLLRVIGGLSVSETAAAVDKSEAAVRQAQSRALRTLAEGMRQSDRDMIGWED